MENDSQEINNNDSSKIAPKHVLLLRKKWTAVFGEKHRDDLVNCELDLQSQLIAQNEQTSDESRAPRDMLRA